MISAFPALYSHRVAISVSFVLLIMFINLRGVKESGAIFAVPTYFFIVMLLLTVGISFFRYFAGTLGTVPSPPELELQATLRPITLFLLLHAFSSGTTALTGVEAISNGITAFREPRSRNAGVTLIWMSIILGTLFLGITYLAGQIGAVPSEQETVISQLARTAFGGRGGLYLATIAATTLILVMAANTAYADFPRLAALQAGDGFLPRQLTYRGSRLVFSRGIAVLAVMASVLIVVFQASVTNLIPLYAIGVFLSFTLSQAGMTRRWWKSGHLAPGQELKERGSVLRYHPGWALKMFVNGLGAVLTAIVALVFAITKFHDGAWVVIIIIPTLVAFFFAIHRHYRRPEEPPLPGRLGRAAAHPAPPRHPSRERHPSGHCRGPAVRARPLRRHHGRPRLHGPRRGRERPAEVGTVGERRAARDPGVALQAPAGACPRLHQSSRGHATAQRDHHDRGAAVRAAPAVAQPAPRPDRDPPPAGSPVQAGDRDHERPLPRRPRGARGTTPRAAASRPRRTSTLTIRPRVPAIA